MRMNRFSCFFHPRTLGQKNHNKIVLLQNFLGVREARAKNYNAIFGPPTPTFPVGAKKSKQLHGESGHRQSRRFDDLLARGGQSGQRQNRSRFALPRMQRRFLEPEVKLATAAVAWERRCWRLAFRTVCRTGDLDMKMLGVT